MKREFNYETITIQDIENNSHLIFICDADKKIVKIEKEEKYKKEGKK